ncbi:hypothetical protein MLD38_027201 [Melastoma candidum]|uniref:Uncharacterized protein n=1 Tax=Melastoma candidum TaxID=119954 RepID=A0ACB9P208_9MYRT|nr:hypothetical protein MLD38_027201 [Melastoma candidum]
MAWRLTSMPELGKEAAVRAIPKITPPLVFCTTSGVDMSGADYQLTKFLSPHDVPSKAVVETVVLHSVAVDA